MANQTANLDAPYISQAQSQPEVVANSAFDVFDGALGSLLVTAMSDANYTLNTSATPDEVTSYMAYKFTGTLTADRNIIIPLDPLSSTYNKKLFAVWNNTTTGHSITLKTNGGTGVAVAYSSTAAYTLLYCDGTNVVAVGSSGGGGGVSSFNTRTGAVVATSGDYSEDEISFTDITTNNASTSKHGYLKKLPNDATKFLDGTGNFSTPAGGGGGGGGSSTLIGWHGWSANAASVSSPIGYGYNPADSVNNAGTLTVVLPTASFPLSWKLSTSSTATSWHEFGDTGATGVTLGTLDQFQSQAALGSLSAQRMFLGLAVDGGTGSIFSADAPSGEPMAMFRYSSAAGDTNFQCVTGSGIGAPTVTDSGIAADTNFHVFKITYDAVTPAIKYWIDGTLVATVTTTLPSNSQKFCTFGHVDNVGAANDKYILLAYIVWSQLPDAGGSGGATSLAGLDDVSITSPTDGQVLTYVSGDGKWENQTPAAAPVPSGTPIMSMGMQTSTPNGPLGTTYSLWLKIPARALQCLPSEWKVRIQRAATCHFTACVILRTAIDSTTVVDSTPVSFGGSFSPTFAGGFETSDAIALPLDTLHDYWVVAYNDTGDSSWWGLKPAVADGSATIGLIGGYHAGDDTGATTIPAISATGFGTPWDGAFAA